MDPELEFEYTENRVRDAGNATVIAIGDPHFKINTLAEMDTFTRRIIACVDQLEPTLVCILGDLMHDHEKIHTKVLNAVYDMIHELRRRVPVYVLVGNHDYINNQQFRTDNHWMNGMKLWSNVYVVDEGCVVDTDAGKIIMCPYVFPGRFKDCLDLVDEDWMSARIVFAHQEILGCRMGAIVSEVGDKWESNYPLLVSGHIHDKQRVGPNVFYTGSSMQHAFGESHDKTIARIVLGEQIRVEKINLELATKRIIYTTISNMNSFVSPLQPDSTDQVKITLSGTVDEFKTFKKTPHYKALAKDPRLKIVYKEKRTVVAQSTGNEKSFREILYDTVCGDSELLKIYTELV